MPLTCLQEPLSSCTFRSAACIYVCILSANKDSAANDRFSEEWSLSASQRVRWMFEMKWRNLGFYLFVLFRFCVAHL